MMRRADPRIEWMSDQLTLLQASQEITQAFHYMVSSMVLEADIDGLATTEEFIRHMAQQKMRDLKLR